MTDEEKVPAIIMEDDPGYLDDDADMVNRWSGRKEIRIV